MQEWEEGESGEEGSWLTRLILLFPALCHLVPIKPMTPGLWDVDVKTEAERVERAESKIP